mgnify:CR=1 FL=1
MQRPSWRNFDPFLVVFAVVLVAYGLTVISSATRAEGVAYSGTFARQAVIASFGVALMVGLSFVDYRVIGQVAPKTKVPMPSTTTRMASVPMYKNGATWPITR